MNAPVIATRGLTKRYGPHLAVDRLDLEVRPGEVYGLLGPNGSGKTTTILMLLGLTEPSSGSLTVLGLDPRSRPISVKRQVGYLPDTVGFYDELTAWENLRYSARLNGIERREAERRIGPALERMGLKEVAHQRVGTYSRGMRQRLGLAELLLKAPKVAILDEPTLGLDPEAASDFLQTVRELREEGITVLLSSHLLHQVQAVCDRVGLFCRGRMELAGTVEELARRVLGTVWRIHLEVSPDQGDGAVSRLEAALKGLAGVGAVHGQEKGAWVIEAERDVRAEIVRAALSAGNEVLGLKLEKPGLDEVYTRYFQEKSHEA